MAAPSRMMLKKSSSAALNLVTKFKPIQLSLPSLPFVESSAAPRLMLFNQQAVSEENMSTQQLPVWLVRPPLVAEEMLLARRPPKVPEFSEDEEDEEIEDDSDIEMIDDDEDDEDDDEFNDEDDEFIKTKVRTRSHRDL